jgi:hypothetical protein
LDLNGEIIIDVLAHSLACFFCQEALSHASILYHHLIPPIQDVKTSTGRYTVCSNQKELKWIIIESIVHSLIEKFVRVAIRETMTWHIYKLYDTRNIIEYYEIFSKFEMQKEIEPVLDSMWKINSEYKQNAYPEPMLYGWNFGEKDDWRKLIELQKQHPDETYLLNDD